MKKKQTLAVLLAAAMVLSMPVGVYAEELDVEGNASSLVEPYISDSEAPELTGITISDTQVEAGGKLTLSVKAREEISGIWYCDAVFENKANGRKITAWSEDSKNPTELTIDVSEYEPSGTFELVSVQLGDGADNYVMYHEEAFGDWKELPYDISFTVTGNDKADQEAPELTGITISDTQVEAGGKLALSVKAREEISGIWYCDAVFENKANGRKITAWSEDSKNPTELTIDVSEYEPSGTFELVSVQLGDGADNYVMYHEEAFGDWKELPYDLSFTVINDDTVTPPPTAPETPSNPSNPTTPSRPNSSTTATTAPGTPINYESEKPDPADEQAVEVYNFWQNTKREIRVYERAGSLRVYVPADVTYMPASVMETLRVENVPVVLQWQGHRIEIPAGKAQPKQPLKAYWPMKTLCELYNA